jgi:uncharacterized protein
MGDTTVPARKARGFAAMDPARQAEIASQGGKAAHEKGTAHTFSQDEARAAGKKGGSTIAQDREHMAAIGRLGGKALGKKRRRAKAADATLEDE